MKFISNFFLVAFVLLSHGCQDKKVYTVEDCNQLSMENFRGLPKSAKALKDHCSEVPITYTASKCQQALTELAVTGNATYLKQKYGSEILNCFSENDIQKFLKR